MCPEYDVLGCTAVGAPQGPGKLITEQRTDGLWYASFKANDSEVVFPIGGGFGPDVDGGDQHLVFELSVVTGHVFGLEDPKA